MIAVLNELIGILTGGLTQMATGIGTGVADLVKNLFLSGAGTTESPYTLGVFGSVVAVFAGVSLAVSMGRKIFNYIASLGSRH